MAVVEGPTREDARGPGKKTGPVDENILVGSRAEFLARLQRFTDTVLERLGEASGGKDVDEKELRMMSGEALKVLNLWEKSLHDDQPEPSNDNSEPGEEEAPRAQEGRRLARVGGF